MEPLKRVRIEIGVILMLLALGLGGLAILGPFAAAGHSKMTVEQPILVRSTQAHTAGQSSSYAAVLKPVLPEIVNIASTKIIRGNPSDPMAPFFEDPLFRRFFGDRLPRSRGPREEREQSLGSGVIVGTNGYILTNSHVVDGASEVKVYLRDKREFTARIVGTDPKTDVAVLKVDAASLPAIPLGDSSKVDVGDVVFAVGNPFGVGQTVTMGIVSATGRGNLGIEDYEDFIQTDAAINPGNSGGALIDTRGELIGINTAILSRSGGNQGVGFAIPVNLARHVMEQITKNGRVIRGWLGAVIQDVTPAMAKAFGLPQTEGVLIGDVKAESPAARADLQSGDVILEMNGAPVADSKSLRLQISQSSPGEVVRMKVRRGNELKEVAVTLGELPVEATQASTETGDANALGGVTVEGLTPEIRGQLDLPAGMHGVVVTQVDANSAVANSGVREGDVIVEVNRRPIHSVQEFEQAARSAGKQPVLLRVVRDGSGFYLVIQP